MLTSQINAESWNNLQSWIKLLRFKLIASRPAFMPGSGDTRLQQTQRYVLQLEYKNYSYLKKYIKKIQRSLFCIFASNRAKKRMTTNRLCFTSYSICSLCPWLVRNVCLSMVQVVKLTRKLRYTSTLSPSTQRLCSRSSRINP